ncbi:hypothetical protein VTJ83DRAFT_3241 [Remersonia thermophila]|uniref:Uncharacterized protein n=1 Tax=Remersonia thermophila TaxID=72144 RepID=A0ABR4DE47_9PEZI
MKPGHTPTASVDASASAEPVHISITLCGDGGCGKSSITMRLVANRFLDSYDPTIEDNFRISRRVDGVPHLLTLTDTAGQEEYRGMWASSNLAADAFLLVYDITNRDSLDALDYFNELIDMEAEAREENLARARRAGLPLAMTSYSTSTTSGGGGSGANRVVPPIKVVAGNKVDLQDSRQVPATVGLDWARRRGCGFMETSARMEVNIEETFALIVKRVVEARRAVEMGVAPGEQVGLGGGDEKGRKQPADARAPSDGGGGGSSSGGGGGSGRDEKRGLKGASGFWRKLRCW